MDAAVAISAAVPPGAADPDIERARELAAAIVATNRGRKKELGLDDRDLETVYAHACSLLTGGDTARAERAFMLLAYIDPFAQRHWLGLAAARERLGRHAPALEAFSVAAELGDRNPLIPLHAAQCHLALGNPVAAGRALDDALAWDGPEHAQAGIR